MECDGIEAVVGWAWSIPPFLQLSSEDRGLLLEATWHELLPLALAQLPDRVDLADLIEAAGDGRERDAGARDARGRDGRNDEGGGVAEDAGKVEDALTSLTLLSVHPNELSCLKAIVLFKPEVSGLTAPDAVRAIQEQV